MSVGINEEKTPKQWNFTQLRRNAHSCKEKKSGRKQPRPGDYDCGQAPAAIDDGHAGITVAGKTISLLYSNAYFVSFIEVDITDCGDLEITPGPEVKIVNKVNKETEVKSGAYEGNGVIKVKMDDDISENSSNAHDHKMKDFVSPPKKKPCFKSVSKCKFMHITNILVCDGYQSQHLITKDHIEITTVTPKTSLAGVYTYNLFMFSILFKTFNRF